MPRSFLIIGTVAWDRVVIVDGPTLPGTRLTGKMGVDPDSDLPAGRLGGGAANAASALVNAGHGAFLYAPISTGRDGDNAISAARRIGIDTRYVQRTDLLTSKTLVLIDPAGERTIVRLFDRAASSERKSKLLSQLVGPDLATLPPLNGVYIRSALPGYQAIIDTAKDAHILAHWPLSSEATPIDAHTLVGSADDLVRHGLDPHHPWPIASEQTAGRLQHVVITRGADGGTIFSANGQINYSTPRVVQVDATGAGDSFAAGLLEALVEKAPIKEAALHAAKWGAITASRIGSSCDMEGELYPPFAAR